MWIRMNFGAVVGVNQPIYIYNEFIKMSFKDSNCIKIPCRVFLLRIPFSVVPRLENIERMFPRNINSNVQKTYGLFRLPWLSYVDRWPLCLGFVAVVVFIQFGCGTAIIKLPLVQIYLKQTWSIRYQIRLDHQSYHAFRQDACFLSPFSLDFFLWESEEDVEVNRDRHEYWECYGY